MIPALLVPSVRPRALLRGGPIVGFVGGATQLTLRQYIISGGFDDSGAGVAWSTSDKTIATVVAGLVTLVGVGSATITATVGGRSYPTNATALLDEASYLRANVSGGDTAILAAYSILTGLTQSGGNATLLPDLRGAVGFGPSLAPNGTGLSVVGTNPATMYLRSDSGKQMQTALSSLFDQSQPLCVVTIGTMNVASAGGNFPTMIANGGLTKLLAIGEDDDGQQSHIRAVAESGAARSRSVKTAKLRLYMSMRSGTTISAHEPPAIAITGTVTTPSSESSRLFWGNGVDERFRAGLVLNHFPSDAECRALMAWAYTYHGAVTGSPYLLAADGDSLAEGWTASDGTEIDARLGWFPQLAERSQYALYDHVNVGVSSSWLDSTNLNPVFNCGVRAVASLDPIASTATHTRRVLILWVGTNDLDALRTHTQLLADLTTYVTSRRAAGWTDIRVLTVIPRNWTAGKETERVSYNSALVTAAASMGIRVIDLTADPAFNNGATSWSNMTYYNADNLHLTAAGYTVVNGLVHADLQAA